MRESSEKQPNPPGKETNPGSRASLFIGVSILFSLIFISYGALILIVGNANSWEVLLALITILYGLYSLAVVAYARKNGGRRPVVAIQSGATVFLVAYVFIVTRDSMFVSGLGSIFAAIGLWCNWIAVVKTVKKQLPPGAGKWR